MGEQLKPCPFCGGIPAILMRDYGMELSHMCKSEDGTPRGFSVIADTQDEVIAAWNNRTPSPREAAIKEMAEALEYMVLKHGNFAGGPWSLPEDDPMAWCRAVLASYKEGGCLEANAAKKRFDKELASLRIEVSAFRKGEGGE